MSNVKNINVVFISGLGVCPTIAVDFLKNILQDINCICLSYPDSQSILGGTAQEKLSCIAEILNKKIPKNSVLVGWSLGGLIASMLMATFPEKYRGLITICSTPKFVENGNWKGISCDNIYAFEKMAQDDVSLLIDKFVRLILFPYAGKKDLNEKLSKLMLDHDFMFYFDLLLKADIRNFFSFSLNRSLHFYGDNDAVLPITVTENYSSTDNIHIVKGQGICHFIRIKRLCCLP